MNKYFICAITFGYCAFCLKKVLAMVKNNAGDMASINFTNQNLLIAYKALRMESIYLERSKG